MKISTGSPKCPPNTHSFVPKNLPTARNVFESNKIELHFNQSPSQKIQKKKQKMKISTGSPICPPNSHSFVPKNLPPARNVFESNKIELHFNQSPSQKIQ